MNDSSYTFGPVPLRTLSKVGGCVMLSLAITTGRVEGLGLRIPNQDAEAIARGNAFVATANNPSALYYNPAGITQLKGQHIQFGVLNYLGITAQYRSPSGGRSETKYEVVPVPQIYYTMSPKDSPLSFGLGVYAPFGLGLEWPENSGFRQLSIAGKLDYITVNPTIAWQVHPTLSLGIGPTLNYSRIKFRQGIGVPTGLGGVPNDEFRYNGQGFDFGFHAGVLWQPHTQWSFGANYRSPGSMNYRGKSELSPYSLGAKPGTSLRVDYPQTVAGGISYRPTPNWNIEVDVDWADWNSVDTLTFKGAVDPFTGANLALPLNWHSSFMYHVGVSRSFANGYFVGVGYFFSANSTSERNFTPTVPDTDLHVGSLGGGYKGKHWDWALAGQLITGPFRTVQGSRPSTFGQSADGQYRLFIPTATFSVGYHF